MAVREILLLGNPILRTRCENVKKFSDPAIKNIITDLLDTLADFRRTHRFGRGIAAPQIGVGEKITVINIDEPLVMINPAIIKRSKQKITLWDDCFSFPNLLVKIKRHMKITVRYLDEVGAKQHLEVEGGLSELLQHEIDHLNGILAVDRAIDSKHVILRSEWEKLARAPKSSYTL